MDIRRWLEETKTPGPPAPLGLPAGQHAREGAPRDAAKQPSSNRRKSKRPQKHTSSDSSLLRPDRANGHVQPVTQTPGNGDRARQHTASDKTASRCSSEPSGWADRSKSELYARRPRRKTRPEIYEPKAGKKRSRRNHDSRKDRHAPTREKDRRRTRPRQPDLAHTFHAKNVAKDRLTLKPNESLGLFKKGRASSPVKGRGLPDLVFSEMRFLQKQVEPVDSRPADETSRKRKKEEAGVGREDEISTYFAAQRAALAEDDTNSPTPKRPKRLPGDKRRKLHDVTSSSAEPMPVEPIVGLPHKPYLGFGARCVGPKNSPDTTYCIPWSKSGRHNSAVAYQRSPRRSLSLQAGVEEQDNTLAHPSNAAAKPSHDEVPQDAVGNVPLESVRPRSVQAKAIGHSAAFFQDEVHDDPSFRANVLQTESPIPPSSHKYRTDKRCQEATNVSPRLLQQKQKGHTVEIDVSEQRKRRPKNAQTGVQAPHAGSRGIGFRIFPNGNAVMAQDAIEVTTDATGMRAPQRSSSPFGKLLRQCDDACHYSPVATTAPVWTQGGNIDMRYVEKSVGSEQAASQVKAYHPTITPHLAGELAEKFPRRYQMQAPDAATDDDDGPDYIAVDDVHVPEIAGIDVMENEEYVCLEDAAGSHLFRDRSRGAASEGDFYHDAEDGFSGTIMCGTERNDGQRAGRHDEGGGSWAGFRRPHKLY